MAKSNNVLIGILILLIILLIGIMLFLGVNFYNSSNPGITGEVILNHYTYTKAICDSSNYCEDYEITCNGGEVLSIVATGNAVQNPLDWKDPRSNTSSKGFC